MPGPQRSVVLWWVLRPGGANRCPFLVQPETLLGQLATFLGLPAMLGMQDEIGPGRAERHPEEQHQQLTQHL